MDVRNIPSTTAANIPMHGDISSGCPRDRSDNVMTNLTAHCSMGVSHENAFTLPPVPGNVMTGTCNCNCDFDMNMYLKNVENSVSRILTKKEMVYHQRLEEVENRLSNLATCLSVLSKDSGVDEASRTSGTAWNTSGTTLVMNMLLNGPATSKRWTICRKRIPALP
jgi:hypothetical protein